MFVFIKFGLQAYHQNVAILEEFSNDQDQPADSWVEAEGFLKKLQFCSKCGTPYHSKRVVFCLIQQFLYWNHSSNLLSASEQSLMVSKKKGK